METPIPTATTQKDAYPKWYAQHPITEQRLIEANQRAAGTWQPAINAIRLDIGCGQHPRPGFVGIDRTLGGEAYPLAYSAERPVEDESVDEIVASHILEHFPHGQVTEVLRGWVNALKPGGKIRLAVPDFSKCCKAYTDGDEVPVMGYVFGGQTNENDYHYAGFDEGLLTEMMTALGLTSIRRWTSELQDAASLPISLNLEGFKREQIQVKSVAVISSRARLGFTLHEWCANNSLWPLGLRPNMCSGVFWSHGLTELMEGAIEREFKYVLTLDHDTAYTRYDVEDLFVLMECNQGVDAIAATQMLREGDRILAVIKDEQGMYQTALSGDEMRQDLLRITSAHFGLTILRCASFAKMNRPWFCEAPDPDGRWGDKRLDADASFWKHWKEAGNTLYQANRVVIGHQQEMIAWPSRRLTPIFQNVNDFMARGKPTDVLR